MSLSPHSERFLSIQAQDFIEENSLRRRINSRKFLSIQAQDFIEDSSGLDELILETLIPEHSSSGLH